MGVGEALGRGGLIAENASRRWFLMGGPIGRRPSKPAARMSDGEMAERTIASVLKTVVPARVPGVRIPLSPQIWERMCHVRTQTSARDCKWCYFGSTVAGMPVKKLSVALDDSVADRASKAAEQRGLSLSAWLNAAAERALTVEAGLAAVAEWEAEHGALSFEELTWADSVLDQSTAR